MYNIHNTNNDNEIVYLITITIIYHMSIKNNNKTKRSRFAHDLKNQNHDRNQNRIKNRNYHSNRIDDRNHNQNDCNYRIVQVDMNIVSFVENYDYR